MNSYVQLLTQELPQVAPERCGFRLASFFCGAGGFDLGFRSAGFELAFANDFFESATKTFKANLDHTPHLGDIRKVHAGEHIPYPIDVLTGGFPCVTFSTAGTRKGVEDTMNGMLYLELCRQIKEVAPRYFVAENVKGMISSNGGRDIKLIQAAFLRLGYRTDYQLVHMAEHGVPQARQRVIFVGVRMDQWRGKFKFPKKTHRLIKDKKAPKWLSRARSLLDAVGDLAEPHEKIVGSIHGDAAAKKGINSGGVVTYVNAKAHTAVEPAPAVVAIRPNCLLVSQIESARNRDFKSPAIPANKPSATVKSDRPPIVTTKDSSTRHMTVHESSRVQSFPDWYEFTGSKTDVYRQIGNAVPPLYSKQLAQAIIEYDRRKPVA